MAFPNTPLGATVELHLGPTLGWVDITADVRLPSAHSGGGIQITRGRANQGATVDPGRCSMVLDNRAGKYSPRNPASPYYGLIGRNTPIRVRVAEGDPGRALWPSITSTTSSTFPQASTPNHASLAITGDLDIRFYGRHPDAQWRSEQGMTLAGRYTGADTSRSWYVAISPTGRPVLVWSPDGTLAARTTVAATTPLPAGYGDRAVRFVLDVNNGAGQYAARFYTAPSLAGPWTQLGADVIGTTGPTTVFAGDAVLEVGAEPDITQPSWDGLVYGFELRNGIGGTVVTSPDFTAAAAGATSLTDAQGRTYTLNRRVSIVDRGARFVGEISSWPVKWDISGRDRWVTIEAAGILRRLGQGVSSVRSPLLRTLLATDPAAYLPLEDGDQANRPSSAATAVGAGESTLVAFGADSTLAGSLTAATLSEPTSRIATMVAARPSATTWSMMLLFKMTAIPSSGADKTYCRVYMAGGRVARWELQASQTAYRWVAIDADGAEITSGSNLFGAGAAPNGWVAMEMLWIKSGSAVNWRPIWHGVGSTAFYSPAASTLANGWGHPVRVEVTGADYMTGASVAHLVVDSAEIPLASDTFRRASIGYAGETAAERMSRLSAETGVTLLFAGAATSTETLGPQKIAPYVDLMRDAAEADGGVLSEPRGLNGLVYTPRTALYNQAPLRISYAGGHISEPFEPVDDDEAITNDVTVSRDGGGSARAVQTTGPLSVAAPPAGVGVYDTTATLQLADDTRLADHAGWRLRLGTIDAARFPRVRVNLAGNAWTADPALRQQVALVDVGGVVELADLPAWIPGGSARVMISGYTETIDAYGWEITWNATPALPWDVAVAEGDARAPVDGSTLASAITATATTLRAATTSASRWTTDPADYPLDLAVGTEQVRADTIGQVINDDAWFAGGLTAWATGGATAAPVAAVGYAGYAGASITAAGGASGGLIAANRVTVTPGAVYVATLWVYSPVPVKAGPAVDWWTPGGVYLNTGFVGPPTVPAGIWTPVSGRLTAPATAATAAMRARHDGTTAAGTTWLTTGVTLAPASTVDTSPQTFTTTGRSVNGVVAAWPAGTPVDVWQPATAPL